MTCIRYFFIYISEFNHPSVPLWFHCLHYHWQFVCKQKKFFFRYSCQISWACWVQIGCFSCCSSSFAINLFLKSFVLQEPTVSSDVCDVCLCHAGLCRIQGTDGALLSRRFQTYSRASCRVSASTVNWRCSAPSTTIM